MFLRPHGRIFNRLVKFHYNFRVFQFPAAMVHKQLNDFLKIAYLCPYDATDTLIGLIEPAMIVLLGLGVGTLLAAVLLPIYNIAGGI